MSNSIYKSDTVEVADDDIIVLGVASVDTQGPGVSGEGDGTMILPGIANE